MPRRFFRRRRRARPYSKPKSVAQRTGVKQAGIVNNGGRRLPGPITIPLSQAVMIQLGGSVGLLSNGSGVVAGVIPCDPTASLSAPFTTGTMFVQYSNWYTLFSQVKCIQLDITIIPTQVDETKGDIDANLAIAGNLSATTNPTSYADLVNNTDSQFYPILLDVSGKGRYHSIRHSKSLLWANSTSPVPTPSLYAGCPGGIGLYGSGFPISTTLGSIRISGTYLVRMWT